MSEWRDIPIYIVDDDSSVREALRYMLEGHGLEIHDYAGGEDFLAQAELHRPGCLILDSRMPGMSGQEVHKALVSQDSCIEVVFLTSHGDLPMAVEAFRTGACDFHQKPVKAADILPSLEKAQQCSLLHVRKRESRQRYEALTEREKAVFNLVVSGKLNKQIAAQLFISLRTVEVHRARLMERMGAGSLADLVKMAENLQD